MIISTNGTIKIGKHEFPIISMDVSYAPFTEYGRPPTPTNVIDSTATVIEEVDIAQRQIDESNLRIFAEVTVPNWPMNVLMLPAPGQKEVVEDDLQE